MCVSVNQESKLFDYQKEVVDYWGKNLICNWSRCLGRTWTIGHIIKDNKPRNVLFISDDNSLKSLKYMLDYMKRFYIDFNNSIKQLSYGRDTIEIKYVDNSITNIYLYTEDIDSRIPNTMEFSYILFNGLLPFETGYKTINSISFININNYDKWLQYQYPYHKIVELDYTKSIEVGLLNEKILEEFKDEENWHRDFGILDNPNIKITNAKFLHQTLFNLQVEYSLLEGNKDTVLTRKNLLDMITRLYQQLRIKTDDTQEICETSKK